MAKFRGIRNFLTPSPSEVINFMRTELFPAMKDLFTGLANLDFVDNFRAYQWTGTLTAGQSVTIAHPLALTPSKFIVVRQTGNTVIADGDAEWDERQVSIKNVGSNSTTVTVLFMR